MWADAQRDGCSAEYRWRLLRKFSNSIPCTTPQSLADARCQYRRTQDWDAKWQNSPKNVYMVYQPRRRPRSCKVWWVFGERRRCSNEAKTRNPLKFARVSKTGINRSQPLVGRSSPYCGTRGGEIDLPCAALPANHRPARPRAQRTSP